MDPVAARAQQRELLLLVRWAVTVATARARIAGLDEDELVSTALQAVHRTLQEPAEGTASAGDRVRGRVWSALHEAGRKEHKRRRREVLADDFVAGLGPVGIDDDEALARACGVEAMALGSPEESLLRREARAHLDLEVTRLAPSDQRLYLLRRRQERTWDEISAQTGIPARTLRAADKRICDGLAAALWALEEEG
jgi:DNA-directed RNA polymerase specialized sigma24 family protein